jgi:hypothetical protein
MTDLINAAEVVSAVAGALITGTVVSLAALFLTGAI